MTVDEALKLAIQAHTAGDSGRAESICRRALKAAPDHPGATHFLGFLADHSGRHQEALQLLQRSIELNPAVGQFHANFGRVLATVGRLEEAVVEIQTAIAMGQGDFRVYQNLSLALGRLGRKAEALAACRRALQLEPNYAEAHWNLGLTLLQMGEFAEGWEEYEWRMAIPRMGVKRDFPGPQWNGEDLSGKTLLIHIEGGYGDALHFCRYIPMLRDRKARLILECLPALDSLFSRIPGIDQIIPRGIAPPDFDFHIPLPGLPRIFGTRLHNIPHSVPYLNAPPQRIADWAGRIHKDEKVNVGLAWAGSRRPNDIRGRSLAVFAPLARAHHVRFHSLQIGPEAAEPRPTGMEVIDYSADLKDFAETAALVQQLDLVISIDTSVAHLAGALARPVWVLLPFNSDFRWLWNRNDSPWYPTMRLFRQSKIGDWETPIREMAQALESFQRG